jgi:hypothetical protein
MLVFFILCGTRSMIVAYMLEMCLFLPLSHPCAFFHKTVKKASIQAKCVVSKFDKTADKKDDSSFTKYLSEGMFSWSYTVP